MHVPDLVNGSPLSFRSRMSKEEAQGLPVQEAGPMEEMEASEQEPGIFDPPFDQVPKKGKAADPSVPEKALDPVRRKKIGAGDPFRHSFDQAKGKLSAQAVSEENSAFGTERIEEAGHDGRPFILPDRVLFHSIGRVSGPPMAEEVEAVEGELRSNMRGEESKVFALSAVPMKAEDRKRSVPEAEVFQAKRPMLVVFVTCFGISRHTLVRA